MNQKGILDDIDISIAILRHRQEIVLGLPVGTYLSLTGLERQWNGRGQYTSNEFQAFVKPMSYNRLSVRCRIVATNAKCFKGDPGTINFDCIKKWEPLKIEDLPRAMSWKKFPLFEKLLQEGMEEGSGKIDTIPFKDLKVRINKAAIASWQRYSIPCPVCTRDLHLNNPHTHKCHACGYSFRTPENLRDLLLKEK